MEAPKASTAEATGPPHITPAAKISKELERDTVGALTLVLTSETPSSAAGQEGGADGANKVVRGARSEAVLEVGLVWEGRRFLLV